MLPLHQFEVMIENDSKELVQSVVNKVYKGVTSRTPVRTGQTRQSWNMSEGQRDISTVDEGGSPDNPLPSPTKKISVTGFKPVYITNAKKHVIYLEYGSPTTAASAMVRATLSSL